MGEVRDALGATNGKREGDLQEIHGIFQGGEGVGHVEGAVVDSLSEAPTQQLCALPRRPRELGQDRGQDPSVTMATRLLQRPPAILGRILGKIYHGARGFKRQIDRNWANTLVLTGPVEPKVAEVGSTIGRLQIEIRRPAKFLVAKLGPQGLKIATLF